MRLRAGHGACLGFPPPAPRASLPAPLSLQEEEKPAHREVREGRLRDSGPVAVGLRATDWIREAHGTTEEPQTREDSRGRAQPAFVPAWCSPSARPPHGRPAALSHHRKPPQLPLPPPHSWGRSPHASPLPHSDPARSPASVSGAGAAAGTQGRETGRRWFREQSRGGGAGSGDLTRSPPAVVNSTVSWKSVKITSKWFHEETGKREPESLLEQTGRRLGGLQGPGLPSRVGAFTMIRTYLSNGPKDAERLNTGGRASTPTL